MLICLCHAAAVDPFHIVMIDKRAQNRFYRAAAPFGEKTGVVFVTVQLFVHLIV